MDIKQIAIEAGLISGNDLEATYSDWEKELNLFAQKIIAARDAEWMAGLVGYVNPAVINSLSNKWSSTTTITPHVAFSTDVALYIQPKEVK